MPFNTSPIIDNPFNTTFSTYTNLLGSMFWLIPLSVIAAALYVKTQNLIAVFAFLVASTSLLSAGNMYVGSPEIAYLYLVFGMLALVGLVLSIYFIRR